jgi:hypothetical protein
VKLALLNGWVVHIDDPAVQPGNDCNCICSNCGVAIVAIKNDKSDGNHFAHTVGSCQYDHSIAIHLFAKQEIASAKVVKLPDLKVILPPVMSERGMTLLPEFALNKQIGAMILDSVNVAVGVEAEIADLRCTKDGSTFFIRLATKGPLELEGADIAKQRDISLMEIDLSNAPVNCDIQKLQAYVLEQSPRRWVSNPKLRHWVKKQISDRKANSARHIEVLKPDGKRVGSISAVLTAQMTLLTLSNVNQCGACQLLSTSSEFCSHCSSSNVTKVKSSGIHKEALPLLVRQRYKESA